MYIQVRLDNSTSFSSGSSLNAPYSKLRISGSAPASLSSEPRARLQTCQPQGRVAVKGLGFKASESGVLGFGFRASEFRVW